MAFPVVGARNNSIEGSNVGTHTVALDGSISENDLLIVAFAPDGGDDITVPSGWTRFGDENEGSIHIHLLWKKAGASEASTLDIDTPSSEQSVHRYWRFTSASITDPDTIPPEAGTAQASNNAAPLPPPLDPTWTSGDDTYFIVYYAQDDIDATTGFPTNYDTNQVSQASNAASGGAVSDGAAEDEVSTSGTETPDAFTIANSDDWCSALIAVPPSGASASAFLPETTDWRWFQDDAQDPTTGNALAAENTKPVLADALNHAVIRLRVLIEENGSTSSTDKILKLQASGDGTTWWDATDTSGNMHISVTDGQGINGTTIATTRLTNANTAGEYHEDQAGTESLSADETGLEIDFAVVTTIFVPGATYSFRLLWDGVAIPVKGGSSVIQLEGTAEADRSNTVVKLDLVSASGEPDTLNVSHNRDLFYDGDRWWVFYNQQVASQATLMRYKSTTDLTGAWSSESTIAFTDIQAPQRQSLTFKTIGGTKYVFMLVASTASQWYLKRGSISGSTITWDSERSLTLMPSGADISGSPVLSIDDGDFLWVAGLADGVTTDVWAARSVNVASDATYFTFNTIKQLTDAGVEGGADYHHIIGLASSEAIVFYIDFGGGELKAVKVTESGGFGTPVIVEAGFGGSNEGDWGVVRGTDGNVYCVFKDSTSNNADLALEVYDESGDSWAAGTSPGMTGIGTSTDGHPLAWGDDDKLYAFMTNVGGAGGDDTRVQYKSYTGGTSGTWDGSLTTMPGSGPAQGNKDGIMSQLSDGLPMGGKIVVVGEEGDDPHTGTEWILGFYVIDAAGGAEEGTASGTGSGTGAATGLPTHKGTATGVGSGTGAATGVKTGTASGTGSGTGAATGVPTHKGTATGTGSGTGAATGVKTGTASGTGSGTGAATGLPTHKATATGTGSGAGAATGVKVGAPEEGTASGTGSGTGAAAGLPIHKGTATGTGSGAGAATGVNVSGPKEGTASGTGSGTGTATGVKTGTASGTGSGTGAATGVPTHKGTASGTGSGAGSATGAKAGTASGTGSGTGAATGQRTGVGTASGTGSGSGAATGQRIRKGTASGTGVGVGAATGLPTHKGTATGTGSGTGAATGNKVQAKAGTASGVGVGTGAASGKAKHKATAAGVGSGHGSASFKFPDIPPMSLRSTFQFKTPGLGTTSISRRIR